MAGVELDPAGLTVRAGDYGTLHPGAAEDRARARASGCSRLLPADESLESVFSYLVAA